MCFLNLRVKGLKAANDNGGPLLNSGDVNAYFCSSKELTSFRISVVSQADDVIRLELKTVACASDILLD